MFFLLLAHAAWADMKSELERMFPYQKIIGIRKTPYLGLYEVDFEDHLIYVDEKMNYIVSGNIFDLHGMKNLTGEREKKLYAIRFDKLPLDAAIRKGAGRKRLAVFSDPNCGYCRMLEKELQGLKGASVYIFPVSILPGSEEKNRAIWCSPDRLKSWEAQMLEKRDPAPRGQCDTSDLGRISQLAGRLGITVTPTLVFEDGSTNSGWLPLHEIENRLARK